MNRDKLIDDITPALEMLEGVEDTTYIPKNKDGSVMGSSGVTIGKGIDLGSRSEDNLRELGFSEDSIAQLSKYIGLKGEAAAKALRDNGPVTISDDELDITTDAIVGEEVDKFVTNFEDKVGYSVDELPEQVLQGLAIQSFQLGNKMYEYDKKVNVGTAEKPVYETQTVKTNFLQELKDKDFAKAAKNMGSWNNNSAEGLRKRYGFAGEVMAGKTAVDDLTRADDILAEIKAGNYRQVSVDDYGEPLPEAVATEEAPAAFSQDTGLTTLVEDDLLVDSVTGAPMVDELPSEEEYIPAQAMLPMGRRDRIRQRRERRKLERAKRLRERRELMETDLSSDVGRIFTGMFS